METLKRLKGWWITLGILLLGVGIVAPQQLGVLLYKSLLVSLAIVMGYIGDRALFRNGPPIDESQPRDIIHASRLIARALIVLGVILGLTIGL